MFHVLKLTLFKVGFQSICISWVVCSSLRSLWQKHWLSVKLELKVEKLQNWKLIFQSQPLFKVGWELHHRPLSYFLLTSPPNQLTSSSWHLLQFSSLFLTLPPIHLNGLLHNPHFSWHDGLLLYNILFSPQMASFFIFSPSLSYPHDPEMFVEFSALFETHRTSSLCQHHVGPHHQWEQLLV